MTPTRKVTDSVRNILDEADKTLITIPPGHDTCALHPAIERALASIGPVQIALAEGMDRVETSLTEYRQELREMEKSNAERDIKIAVMRNTLKTELRNKALSYGFGVALVTGLVVALADRVLR